MGQKQRVSQQQAWVLHTMPWRETSLIVEVFSRDYGRMALVAKGARRPYSTLRGVLMAFQPLLLDWSGGGEVKTLVRAEWQGGQALLTGLPLLCGYYLNELLVRLTAREDPHAELFDAYIAAIGALASGSESVPRVLRRFELELLQMLGYAPRLESDAVAGDPVQPSQRYLYMLERGPVLWQGEPENEAIIVCGQTLLDLSVADFSRTETLVEAKRLLRLLLDHHLGGQPLQSRRVLRELQEL